MINRIDTRQYPNTFDTTRMISSRIACTANVRVELLRCRTEATVQWSVTRPEVSLMWVRDKGSNASITVAGQHTASIAPGRAKFWFFPEGVDAQGELTGRGAYDCAGVFIDPAFLSPGAKQALAEPIVGFSHDALGRAFDELAGELAEPDELLPMFTEGWAMQALAYVARASRTAEPIAAPTDAVWRHGNFAGRRRCCGRICRRTCRCGTWPRHANCRSVISRVHSRRLLAFRRINGS